VLEAVKYLIILTVILNCVLRAAYRHRKQGAGGTPPTSLKIEKKIFRAIIMQKLGLFGQISYKIPAFC